MTTNRRVAAVLLGLAVVSLAAVGLWQLWGMAAGSAGPSVTIRSITVGGAAPPESPQASAYAYLYAVMDKYATGSALRLLQSYDGADDTAWVYDNTLAMMALMAHGGDEDWARARILADSLVYGQTHDPDGYADGRLRDAYHASALVGANGKVAVAVPDTSTGNMSFVIVALLRYYQARGGAEYLNAAERLGRWLIDNVSDTRGAGGYTGGLYGKPPTNSHSWKGTEHNVDVYVAFMKLYEATGNPSYFQRAMHAKRFLRTMWNEAGGYVWTGTLADGETVSPSPVPEDTQTWTLMALGEVAKYGAGVAWAERDLAVESCAGRGFRFSDRGANAWWEGTAHMAIALMIKGEADKAAGVLATLRRVQSDGPNGNGRGIVAACSGGAPSGFGFDAYPNSLHIGATSWFIFAERGYNPFWGTGTGEAIRYEGIYDGPANSPR